MGKLIQYCTNASKFDGEWKWQGAGMGYVIETENKHYIVVDGGLEHIDAVNIIEMLTSLCGKKPTVDLWIITHPHSDHYNALRFIAQESDLGAMIDIKTVCCSYPDEFIHRERRLADIPILDSALSCLPNCSRLTPNSGDTLDIDGTLVKFLFTYKDALSLSDPNELSLVFSVTGKKRKIMFTGDAYENGLSVVYRRYANEPDTLRSDYVQLAHHGLNGGYTYFYKSVAASVALVPISVSGDRAMQVPEELRGHHNLYAQALASTVIKAHTGTVTLEL